VLILSFYAILQSEIGQLFAPTDKDKSLVWNSHTKESQKFFASGE
jgi:hypothetical protein